MLTTIWVIVGSCPFRLWKIFTKIGTRNISMPIRTSVANVSTTVGYSIALFTRRFSFVSFSI